MSGIDDYMLPCLNKTLFGVECPGCGMQRSVSLIAQGNFKGAFYMYPAIFTLIIMIVFLALHIKFKFKNGHTILLLLFILNIMIIIVSYILKFI
ncbi:DUF2752 domain-containing protein [Gaetbulibacter sp. M235]|uniref:DUF2752 domain-containing protein n=1 Tax=Gaetbulibacter sp. M235 TaxID=3126510 RepID=UPI00374E9E1B